MPTRTSRRARNRRGEGDLLREEILDVTERLLLKTQDADAVSIRAVAHAAGVTPPSIYMHFADKEDLILQVCERGFRVLHQVMEQAVDGLDDPVEAVEAMGRAYVRFGLSHPEQYRILFMVRGSDKASDELRDRVLETSGFGLVVAAVERCIEEGLFRPGDAMTVACGLWAGVHGITSLLISKPSFPWPGVDDLIEHCVDAYCRGLRAQS